MTKSKSMFITLDGHEPLNINDISSIRIDSSQDALGNSNPNLGFDLVVQMRALSSPIRYRCASRDEAQTRLDALCDHMKESGFPIARF